MNYVIQRGAAFYHPAGWRNSPDSAARYQTEDDAQDDRDELLRWTLAGLRGELEVTQVPR